jgi:intracellular septation protein
LAGVCRGGTRPESQPFHRIQEPEADPLGGTPSLVRPLARAATGCRIQTRTGRCKPSVGYRGGMRDDKHVEVAEVLSPQPEARTASEEGSSSAELLKLAIEMGPLLAFFVTNAITGDPFWAIGVFMVAAVIVVPISWKREGRMPVVPVVTAVFVLIFGGIAIYSQNELFIKLKPTVMNALFGSILLAGVLFKRYFLKILLGGAMQLDMAGWRKLSLRWGLFFYLLAIVNEAVHRNVSFDRWVQFKTFGPLVLTIVFTASQLKLMQAHSLESDADSDPSKDPSGPGKRDAGSEKADSMESGT